MRFAPIRDREDLLVRLGALVFMLVMVAGIARVGWLLWPALGASQRDWAIAAIVGYVLGRWHAGR